MRKIILLLSLSTIVLLFNSCDPSENTSSDANFSENFGASVSRDFIGQVVDGDNHPIQGVIVKIGTTSVQTDINGVFIINDASVHEKFAFITAKKAGYIDGSRSMVPTSGKNNVRIMLIQDTPLQTIQSGVTSEVSIYSGTKVTFDGAFMDENGNAYSGAVAVSMFHLTPSDANIDKLMPGMLYAQNENGQAGVLETYGMMHVELKGSNGQKLQIATGHTAQITMRIDNSQLATCPSTIPLWHFDEENGYWKQEGSATKNGNYYVGNVSHFSWWNCDTFLSTTYLTVTVVDSNGNPLSNVGVSLVVNSTNFNSYIQYTDNNGQVSGVIPANQNLSLNLSDNCSNIIYSSQIGPFASNTILTTITLNPINQTEIASKITGKLLKCDNTNCTNGYVLLNYRGKISLATLDSSGEFNFSVLACSNFNIFEIEGYDFENQQSTSRISYSFNFPTTSIGELKTCSSTNEFMICKIDNLPPRYFTSPINTSMFNNGTNGIDILYYGSDGYFSISWFNATYLIGTYTNNNFLMETSYSGLQSTAYILSNNSSIVYKVNKFGAVGDYIDITFNGTYNDTQTHSISGIVHVLRDN